MCSQDIELTNIIIYADGACSGNPGPGGWGAIIICEKLGLRKEISGAEEVSTNNRMELTAVIQGLSILKKKCSVKVFTDSSYITQAFNRGWLKKWQENGWKNAEKKPVKNIELWQKLLNLVKKHEVSWHWIKGHQGNIENEKADRLAVMAREKIAVNINK